MAASTAPSVIGGLPVVYRGTHGDLGQPEMVTIRPGRRRSRQEAPDALDDNPKLRGLLLDLVI